MEKAFDKAVLVERLKAQGLPVAEEALAKIATTIFEWTDESMGLEQGFYEQFGRPAVGIVRKFVMAKIDALDGQVDARE